MIRDSISPRARVAYAPHYTLEPGKPVDVCIVMGCLKHIRVTGGRKGALCHAHNLRLWRKKNPIAAQFHRLKAEARKRKKPFDITRAEWDEVCRLTRYHEGTASVVGSVREGLTVDRIEHRRGYTLDNIQVITCALNSTKGAQEMTCRLHTGRHIKLRTGAVSVADQLRNEAEEIERNLENL